MKATGKGLFGKGGPLNGIQKNIIADACRKMGLTIPVKAF
jgi:hypothetical protein